MKRVLTGTALLVAVLLVTGWVGARKAYPMHMKAVTGRADISLRSCTYCHRDVEAPPTRNTTALTRYISPTGLAVTPDGAALFVAASGANRLLEIELATGRLVRQVDVPGGPHGVAISADGLRIAVGSRDGDRVHVLERTSLKPLGQVAVAEPLGLLFARSGDSLWVAGAYGDELLSVTIGEDTATTGLAAGNEPYAVALASDGGVIAVANRLARPVGPNVVPEAELTIVDVASGRVRERRRLVSAHLSEGVAVARDGSFALASAVRVRNLLPLTQVARGGVMTSALVFADLRDGGPTVQFPLDEVNRYFADPSGVALTPDDRIAFVAHGGADTVTAIDVGALRRFARTAAPDRLASIAEDLDAAADYVIGRIPTRANPRALALSPNGARLYVAERLADSIAVIDTATLSVIDRIDLGGPEELTVERLGERVFHDASGTFQGQFSCRSCHPDGHSDGLIWDFEIDGLGKNLLETRSLLGIRDTAPFKWSGKNPSLHVQCGPRFARVLTRSDPFSPERLDALVAFIESQALPPKRADPRSEATRHHGEALFSRTRTNSGEEIAMIDRCSTCHRGALFTDRLKADVGTGGAFDTPHLFGVGASPPYLHDGRAPTLEEIWTVHSPEDTHGKTNDLTKVQLNDLVVYLRSL